jgi:hypothetical protein
MILSKLITANRREAIAAPEMKTSTTMRKSEVVLATASFENAGSSYATAIVVDGEWNFLTAYL